MTSQISGKKIMILVANGFVEKDFIAIQRDLLTSGAVCSVISAEKNLVNGFNDGHWGLTFPVNEQVDTTLAADYDALIIIGGEQSIERLSKNLHTARIVESFAETKKPVVVLDEASKLVESVMNENILPVIVEEDTNLSELAISHIVSDMDVAKAA